MLGGTHKILCSCSLAWWPLHQIAARPRSVTCHVLWKGKAEMTVNRAFSREYGTRPCHCCCFFMLLTTLGEKKMLLRTTSKWQKVQSKCNCSPNSNRLCLGTFFHRNLINSLLRTTKDHVALLVFLQNGHCCCWPDLHAPVGQPDLSSEQQKYRCLGSREQMPACLCVLIAPFAAPFRNKVVTR